MPARRKYQKTARCCITTEQWKKAIIEALGVSESDVFNAGFEQILIQHTYSSAFSPELILKVIAQKQAEIDQKVQVLSKIRSILDEKTMILRSEKITMDTFVHHATEIFGNNGTHARKLPERDQHGDHLDWWDEQASRLTQLCGIKVTAAQCQQFVRAQTQEE